MALELGFHQKSLAQLEATVVVLSFDEVCL